MAVMIDKRTLENIGSPVLTEDVEYLVGDHFINTEELEDSRRT